MKILTHGMHMQALCMYMQSLYRHYTVYRQYTSQSAACNMEERCLFEKLYLCSENDPLSQVSTERIIRASKQYEDDLHIELGKQQERSNIESVPVHRKCVDRYCHKRTIQKAMREKAQSASIEDIMDKPKRARRSEKQFFSFLQYCLFCGGKCDIVKILSTQIDGVLRMSVGKGKDSETGG